MDGGTSFPDEGAGTIEVADQVNAMLDRFLTVGLGRNAPLQSA